MFGLIGKKLSHSFSADFFNKKFQKEGIDEEYRLFPIPDIDDFPLLLALNPDLKGLNVTIPYKQQVIPFLSEISEEAKKIGAVNVIKIISENENITLKGYNTDVIGFRDSLIPLLHENVKEALILGTGGASKAVAYVLDSLGIKYTFVSRNPKAGQIAYSSITPEIISKNLLIVNTTPLGMFPNIEEYPEIPYQYLTPEHICYDLIYNPAETQFMKNSALNGAQVKNGLEMLELQALAAWDIWTE